MRTTRTCLASAAFLAATFAAGGASATVNVQCPGDRDGDAVIDRTDSNYPNAVCRHITGGDGFVNMADTNRTGGPRGRLQYIFGFADVTGVPEDEVMTAGNEAANFPAPTITVDEGDQLFLTMTNVGMTRRPDLTDPHTVHWHGFPNASAIFDGVPEASVAPNLGVSFTYFYNVVEPGTFMYHCHMEATEHMQMGMLGNLYVRPAQNRLPPGTPLGSHIHSNPDWNKDRAKDDPTVGDKYVYNDGDGSTRYDVEFPVQIHSFDPEFHDASMTTQPLPFAMMKDTFGMLNGRGYPETINPNTLANTENGVESQKVPAIIQAAKGQRILLRLSSLSVTRYFTLTASGLPMQVVGRGAAIMKGGGQADGAPLYYLTNSVTLGGGEAADVIIDTTGVPAGTYALHATELNFLSNDREDFGGIMTEIVITEG